MQKNAPFLRRSLPSPLHLPLNQHRPYLSTRANCSLESELRSRSASSSSVRPRLRMLFLMSLHLSESLWWTQNHPGPTLRFLRLNWQSTSSRGQLPRASPAHLPLNQHRLLLSTLWKPSLSSKARSRSASSSSVRPRLRMLFLMSLHLSESL